MRESKECEHCGRIYFRAEKVTEVMWAARRYCSAVCSGQALAKRHQRALEEGRALEAPKPAAPAPKEPVVRELRIVRVGPNPRLVVCEYFELAQRRLCTVLVKRTDKFVRGMRLKMAEPLDEMAYRRPWVYQGPPPRHRGRW
jgi:hypothetical protein